MISFTLTSLWTTSALILVYFEPRVLSKFLVFRRADFFPCQSGLFPAAAKPPKSFVSIFFEFLSV